MRYLVQAVVALVLVALGLRLAAWLITPVLPVLVGLLFVLLLLTGLFFPQTLRRR